jgi:hypothetical protein
MDNLSTDFLRDRPAGMTNNADRPSIYLLVLVGTLAAVFIGYLLLDAYRGHRHKKLVKRLKEKARLTSQNNDSG